MRHVQMLEDFVVEAVGAIEHLKGLGWTNYQWRYVAQERIDKNVVEFGHRMGCFAEFFSPHYHGYLRGEVRCCPDCHSETEVYSRVVGYLRPVQQWNEGKRAEFERRSKFRVEGVPVR